MDAYNAEPFLSLCRWAVPALRKIIPASILCRFRSGGVDKTSKGLLMGSETTLLSRTFVWLTVALLPLQSLPAAACGCGKRVEKRSASTSQECCCRREQRKSCCQSKQAETKCCEAEQEDCGCGASCACGQKRPPRPATLPVLTNVKIVSKVVLVSILSTIIEPPSARQSDRASCRMPADSSLLHCAQLCRFTL